MLIRPRVPEDVGGCVDILEGTHEADGYPIAWPDVPEDFVVRRRELGAWVAEVDGAVAGHVSIQTSEEWVGWQATSDATGAAPDDVAVVSALFASVEHRRAGLGRALLDHAAHQSFAVRRHPALDVGKSLVAAVALYERAGWQRIGETAFMFGTTPIESWVYLGPKP